MPLSTIAATLIAAAPTSLIPWLDPHAIIVGAGPWALLVVCLIVFAETGLLVGFILPGDTLLIITGLLTFTGTMTDGRHRHPDPHLVGVPRDRGRRVPRR